MLEPNYLVLIAPGADAGEVAPAWADISPDLLALPEIRRGSPSDLDRNNPGTISVVVDNWSGDYDNENPDSPYHQNLVPMTQILVYAEHDGDLHPRFRGFLDQVALDYPGEGEATATVTATDAFKPLAQTTLPSAYAVEVLADNPSRWWRLDEPEGATTLYDAMGDFDLPVSGAPTFGADGLVARDPGTSMEITGSGQGSYGPGPGPGYTAFTVEMLFRSTATDDGALFAETNDIGTQGFLLRVDGSPDTFGFIVATSAGSTGLVSSAITVDDDAVHHVVLSWDGANVRLYVDGALAAGPTALAGTIAATTNSIVAIGGYSVGPNTVGGCTGFYDEVAVYPTALSLARVQAHHEAISTPWNNDTPGERAHRICDHIGWPDELRDFDDGSTPLQSADIAGQTALEHLQKIAETDMGAFYVSRDGTLTFRGRDSLANRAPRGLFGPGGAAYRSITFDSSDELVRNPVTISRLEGLAQTAEDPVNLARFFDHQFTLDGLLHDSDDHSRAMANLILSEGKDPKRRITGLGFGPAEEAAIADLYPLLLEAELGDRYDVSFQPPNVAAPFEQRSTLEGTVESWTPQDGHTVAWDLSPILGASSEGFWQIGVAGHSEIGLTTRIWL